MYPLPDDFDPGSLVGKTLVMVSFTSNSTIFELAPDVRITAVCLVSHEVCDGNARWYESATPPLQQSRLMQVAGQEVVECTAEEDATLVLTFENGHVVRCEGDCGPYEAYELRVGSREIMV